MHITKVDGRRFPSRMLISLQVHVKHTSDADVE